MKKTNYDLKQLQLEQLSVLDELKRVCDKHHLTFYLAYGSCLGALRHHGFIPWDDDIDVLMPVKDYDKLMNLANEFQHPFLLQNNETDSNFKLAIARVRKRGTACIEEKDLDDECHQGIFVDIYPQYQYPDHLLSRLKIISSSIIYRILLYNEPPKNHGVAIKFVGNIILKLFSLGGREKQIAKYRGNLRKYSHTAYVADLYGMDLTLTKVIKYKSGWFLEPKWITFEGRRMPVPTKAVAYLKERYGENCMELPPPEKRHSYHRYAYVDFEHEYKKR